MKQPALGVVATVLVMALSLAFMSLFSYPVLSGWVAFILTCLIPAQVMIGVLLKPKPGEGIRLVLMNVGLGVLAFIVQLRALGGGITPPTPMLMHATIVSVVVTFWLCVIWGGWPFTLLYTKPKLVGIVTLSVAYILNGILFRLLFSYEFMRGAPVYVEALDPHGPFNAWSVLALYVTTLIPMFTVLHFDLGPLARLKQPLLGLVWSIVALGGGAILFELGTGLAGMDPVVFLVRITVPFIFGTIVVLNMLQNSLFSALKQPIRGVVNTVASLIIGVVLAELYRALATAVSGSLGSGPPAYESEIWLATALLSVTFPFLIFFAEFFGFWPLRTGNGER